MRGPGTFYHPDFSWSTYWHNTDNACWYSVIISLFAIVILSVLGSLYKVRCRCKEDWEAVNEYGGNRATYKKKG